jgi:hypothetical protein
MRACRLSERLRHTRDWAAQQAARLVPYRVRYWSMIDLVARAVMDSRDVPATPIADVLTNIRVPKGTA